MESFFVVWTCRGEGQKLFTVLIELIMIIMPSEVHFYSVSDFLFSISILLREAAFSFHALSTL
jgi:hypothetical protein